MRHIVGPAVALSASLLALGLLCSCSRETASNASALSASGAQRLDALSREAFNRKAAERFAPLFWREDSNRDRTIQPDELAVLWGFPDSDVNRWIDQSGDFTASFRETYASLTQEEPAVSDEAERRRLDLVREELAQGVPTLVQTSFQQDSVAERAMMRNMLKVAELIERLYARQRGVLELEPKIPREDYSSRALFHRNQSPYCEAPKTANDPACTALAPKPPRVFGLYPAELQKDPAFCERLARQPNAKALMDPFSVVVAGKRPGTFEAVPYSVAYEEDMQLIADELEAAARNFKDDDEPALTAYLRAAAQAFRTNDWVPADRAWVAMTPQNSKWYVRVAPDEVYYDPCAWKAGFALQVARINPESVEWQKRLDPLKQDMERTLASLAGSPYQARKVGFKLPDFIDVVLNAGDQRKPLSATVGQSLPNWGPVAESGGRTVAMTNLYTDPDSLARRASLEASVFCPATQRKATTSGRESLISSVLHEAAHNLGPSTDYAVNGRSAPAIFGGPMAATLEELKAQTSSMFLTHWLTGRGIFTPEDAERIQRQAVSWMLGQISNGMYTPEGSPRNYSQLAAIQLGSFMEAGAIAWKPQETAANGQDTGCLEIDFQKLPAAVEALEATVLRIKASGDRAGAERLKAKFVDAKDDFASIRQSLTERWLRSPRTSFVYSLVF